MAGAACFYFILFYFLYFSWLRVSAYHLQHGLSCVSVGSVWRDGRHAGEMHGPHGAASQPSAWGSRGKAKHLFRLFWESRKKPGERWKTPVLLPEEAMVL